MMRLSLAAVALAVLALSGCSSTQDLTTAAYTACQESIDAQYDSVTWPKTADITADGDEYTVVATIEADGQQSEATCQLTREDDSWQLSSYNVVAK